MKIEKIISLGIVNLLALITISGFVLSCQKRTVHSTGFFTDYSPNNQNRVPASVMTNSHKGLDHYLNFQDSKQIYIFCKQSSIKVEQCFQDHFNKKLVSYAKKYGPLSSELIKDIKTYNKYHQIHTQMNKLNLNLLDGLDHDIYKLVKQRKSFCKENSKINLERCLTQYLDRDSFALVNKFQQQNARLNGHEYIYLKNIVFKELDKRLGKAHHQLTTKPTSYDHTGDQKDIYHK